MSRKFTESSLLIATHNEGKLIELSELFSHCRPITLHSAASYNLVEPEEVGADFAANARIKAEYYGSKTGLPALADDSGLSVASLDGAPGVHSARWAGKEKDFGSACTRIQHSLEEKQRAGKEITYDAAFICALCLRWPDGYMEEVEGVIKGTLTFPPRGNTGFGYDPIFIPESYTQTFAEMQKDAKNRISHRARAFEALIARCFV